MSLEPIYHISTGEMAFWYVYKGTPRVMRCDGVVDDTWIDFKHLCREKRYKEAMNLIKKYIKEQE